LKTAFLRIRDRAAEKSALAKMDIALNPLRPDGRQESWRFVVG
jgi:hypothetical protein